MAKGIVYLMTTAVDGIIKIGKTETKNFQERMRNLEKNGYYNVVGLKRYFAIELSDYADKEKLLDEIFAKHRIGSGELFALDVDLVKQLLLAFEGRVVYPASVNREKEFENVVKSRKQGQLFSFYRKGIKDGAKIVFIQDKNIVATVVGERAVKYNDKIMKLSPLVYEIFADKGRLNKSGAYQGANYFSYKGVKLTQIPDKN